VFAKEVTNTFDAGAKATHGSDRLARLDGGPNERWNLVRRALSDVRG